ncbi:hypothetical protein YC2023_078624 [Brassica napus]
MKEGLRHRETIQTDRAKLLLCVSNQTERICSLKLLDVPIMVSSFLLYLARLTRQNSPVTSGEEVPPHKGGRSDQARATVYQKHRSPQSRKTMYGG